MEVLVNDTSKNTFKEGKEEASFIVLGWLLDISQTSILYRKPYITPVETDFKFPLTRVVIHTNGHVI